MSDQLKPCPFCGDDEPTVDGSETEGNTATRMMWVGCVCGAQSPWKHNSAEAIDAWNRRPAPAVELVGLPVGVKALEWSPCEHTNQWIASSIVGQYFAWNDGVWRAPGSFGAVVSGSIEAAKAAAQSDFDQRIRSALVPA